VKKTSMALLSKKMVGLVLLLVQLIVFYVFFYVLKEYSFYLYGGCTLAGVFVVFYIINRNTDGGIKQTWLILIALMPVFGICLYLYVLADVPSLKLRKRISDVTEKSKYIIENDVGCINFLKNSGDCESGIFHYLYHTAYASVYCKTSSEYYPLGEDAFASMINELKKAESFIFMEYFIINSEGHMWNLIFEILKEKAEKGVDVRIIYDGMGSMLTTENDFEDILKDSGIKCHTFAPVKPFLSTYQNNRDHRKMLVIDGKTVFTGGINISDEYINRRKLFGHWKDNSVMLKGDAVRAFTLMFLRMWNTLSSDNVKYDEFIDDFTNINDALSDGYVCPYSDGPSGESRIAKSVYISILDNAREYVHIMTPYLVLDEEMREALKFAARRGVDVKILMPHVPDKWYAFALARTYYPELINSGVKIYEYTPGFVHAKTVVSDDVRAVVGTSNFDYRSLFLHYECCAYFYKSGIINCIEKDFDDAIGKSQLFSVRDYNSSSLFMRIAGRFLRAFAPLM